MSFMEMPRSSQSFDTSELRVSDHTRPSGGPLLGRVSRDCSQTWPAPSTEEPEQVQIPSLGTYSSTFGRFFVGTGSDTESDVTDPDIPSWMQSSPDGERWPSLHACSPLANLTFTLCMIASTAYIGYEVFGTAITSNLFQQLRMDWWVRAACLLLAGHMVVAYAVLLIPVLALAEHAFNVQDSAWTTRAMVRLGISLICVFTAVAFPFFNQVCGLISSISTSYLCFWGPPLFWLATCGKEEKGCWSRINKTLAVVQCVVLFAVGMGLGVYASASSFIDSLDKLGLFAANGASE